MDLELRDRVVLVTGGSKGIGLACAKAFAAEDARLALASRSEASLAEAARVVGGALTIAADLSQPDEAARVVDQVELELGPIDILINSAGAARRTPPDELTPAAWRAAMDAKYFTYINVIDPTIKRMVARRRGVIINIVGNGGKVASSSHLAGGAANAALMLATVGLANAYAKQGVRVLAINPGLTNTGRVAEGLQATARQHGISVEEALRRSVEQLAIGRLAEPEEIAMLVVFAASPRASYLTGVTISMDGASTPIVV
jgi:NAD(P)-dependent dehydrogenase (short-subunit alcohol dehydrogenase family)